MSLAGVAGAQPAPPAASGESPARAGAQSPAEQSRSLVALASQLVETAASGKGGATAFRIDVAYYRESLRDLMKEDAARPMQERLPKALLMDMVRMIALLQSAAECQSGRYIVCPADLIERLRRQQATVERQLAAPAANR